MRARAGGVPLDGGDYVAEHASGACAEILRAFPGVDGSKPWKQARAALEMFDYIYDTDAFEAQARAVFDVLDVPVESLTWDNVSDRKTLPPEFEPVMRRGFDLIGRETGFLEQDLALWEWARPRLGHIVAPTRPRAGPSDLARAAFCARETGYLVHEFDALGRLAELRAGAEGWAVTARAVLGRVAEYGA